MPRLIPLRFRAASEPGGRGHRRRSPRARWRLWGALLLASGSAGAAAPATLPPVSGELSGQFTVPKFPGAPPLQWKLSLGEGDAAGVRRAGLQVEGAGTFLRGEVLLEEWDSARWRIAEGRVDIASWFSTLATFVGEPLSGVTAEGLALLNGSGTWQDAAVRGRVEFELRDAIVRDPDADWVVEGLSLHGRFADIPEPASDGEVTLTFREASGAGIIARDGRIEFSVDGQRRIHVQAASMNLMDGRVNFSPFVFDPANPEVRTHAMFDRVELARFARFLPDVLAEANGPVSGGMLISWSVKDGLRSASGTLHAHHETAAAIRLAASPGFLTSRLPAGVRERIDLLPKWLGPIRKLFQPANPAYSTLRDIEMGDASLELTTLEISVNTSGDAAGRTARIVAMAKPAASDTVVESVRLEVNVVGPLADLLKLGLEGRIKVHTR
jgi:hypothetical protein